MRTALALFASVMLFSGCLPRHHVIPDKSVPHQVAQPAKVVIWVRKADGEKVQERIWLMPGDWVADSRVVE
jgi:hypothetical protein